MNIIPKKHVEIIENCNNVVDRWAGTPGSYAVDYLKNNLSTNFRVHCILPIKPQLSILCLALLVQGVNGRLLDNCQVSSLPMIARLRNHLKAFAGVLS